MLPTLKEAYVILFLASFTIVFSKTTSTRKQFVQPFVTAEETLAALENIVLYYSTHMQDITLDFSFGIRVLQGELERTLRISKNNMHTNVWKKPEIQLGFMRLFNMTNAAMSKSVPFLIKSDKEYYDKLHFVIDSPWNSYEVPPQISDVKRIEVIPVKTGEMFNEESSDYCMKSLLIAESSNRCPLDNCWKNMTQNGYSLYTPTHQLIWLQLGVKMGCRPAMNKAAIKDGYKGGFDELIEQKCAGVVTEMEALARNGVDETAQDIFLEQGFVCGSIGIMDAVRPEWLREALQWMDNKVGCLMADDSEYDFNPEFFRQLSLRRSRWISRKLHMDSVLEDGCSTHQTAVAACFYGTALRLFFDPVYKSRMLDPMQKRVWSLYAYHGYIPKELFVYFVALSTISLFVLFYKRIISIIRLIFLHRCFKQ